MTCTPNFTKGANTTTSDFRAEYLFTRGYSGADQPWSTRARQLSHALQSFTNGANTTTSDSPEDIVGRIKDAQATLPQQNSCLELAREEQQTNQPTDPMGRSKIEENKIRMDSKFHTFTVMGTECPHVVTLFSKETCSCPSTTECYHILAAKTRADGAKKPTRKAKLNPA